MSTLKETDLLEFAASQKINRIGWFQTEKFSAYLQELHNRPEYKLIKYRTATDFEKAGTPSAEFRSVIVITMDYFHDRDYKPDEFKISNYSRYCWNTVNPKAEKLIEFIKSYGHTAARLDIYARGAACLAGLGFIGKNCNFYAEGSGSYVGIVCIGTDLELKNKTTYAEHRKMKSCLKCDRCINACPVKAIAPEGYQINPLRCISFLNRHPEEVNKIFPENKKQLDNWLAGCEICQDVCPCNSKIAHNNIPTEVPSLNLYGMEISNKGSISKKSLSQSENDIKQEEYRDYLNMLF